MFEIVNSRLVVMVSIVKLTLKLNKELFRITDSGLLMSSSSMNFLDMSDTTSKASSSKSHSAVDTFCMVSLSSSPMKGDRPLSL